MEGGLWVVRRRLGAQWDLRCLVHDMVWYGNLSFLLPAAFSLFFNPLFCYFLFSLWDWVGIYLVGGLLFSSYSVTTVTNLMTVGIWGMDIGVFYSFFLLFFLSFEGI